MSQYEILCEWFFPYFYGLKFLGCVQHALEPIIWCYIFLQDYLKPRLVAIVAIIFLLLIFFFIFDFDLFWSTKLILPQYWPSSIWKLKIGSAFQNQTLLLNNRFLRFRKAHTLVASCLRSFFMIYLLSFPLTHKYIKLLPSFNAMQHNGSGIAN